MSVIIYRKTKTPRYLHELSIPEIKCQYKMLKSLNQKKLKLKKKYSHCILSKCKKLGQRISKLKKNIIAIQLKSMPKTLKLVMHKALVSSSDLYYLLMANLLVCKRVRFLRVFLKR